MKIPASISSEVYFINMLLKPKKNDKQVDLIEKSQTKVKKISRMDIVNDRKCVLLKVQKINPYNKVKGSVFSKGSR